MPTLKLAAALALGFATPICAAALGQIAALGWAAWSVQFAAELAALVG